MTTSYTQAVLYHDKPYPLPMAGSLLYYLNLINYNHNTVYVHIVKKASPDPPVLTLSVDSETTRDMDYSHTPLVVTPDLEVRVTTSIYWEDTTPLEHRVVANIFHSPVH